MLRFKKKKEKLLGKKKTIKSIAKYSKYNNMHVQKHSLQNIY